MRPPALGAICMIALAERSSTSVALTTAKLEVPAEVAQSDDLGAVVRLDDHPAREHLRHVIGLTALGPGNGLDVRGPLRTRLEGRVFFARRNHTVRDRD